MNHLILELIIIFIASLIQIITGFGFALIAVPLLAYFTFKHVRLRQIRFIILFGIIGIPFGVYALKILDSNVFRANLSAYGIILNLFTIGTFIVSGAVKNEMIASFIYLIPGLLLGGRLGTMVARKINE